MCLKMPVKHIGLQYGFPHYIGGSLLINHTKNILIIYSCVILFLKSVSSFRLFVLICLAMSSEMLAINGFSTFLQKFVHLRFHLTEGDAALAVGCMVVPGNHVKMN